MIFNSVTYLLFLPLVVCAYWVLPQRPRLWLIALSSVMFYGFWKPEFLIVMFASAATDYLVALKLEKVESVTKRKLLVCVSLSVNLGLLLYFKYLLFFVDNFQAVLSIAGVRLDIPHLNIILPLGISFYTFETISYIIDVYRRVIRAERDFLTYACFITFFPKLIAGPILRAAQLIPQFKVRPAFSVADIYIGLQRIFLGLFLKVVLADNISPLVDEGFALPVAQMGALDVWTLAFLFGFQIYFDFAAYSSIAIGSTRLMGIRLPENFDFPYLAVSPRDFWKRWHISLSSWIRDYLYLPLLGQKFQPRADRPGLAEEQGGGEPSPRKALTVLFVTWTIMGFWHGANWTFILWGLMHACYVAGYRLSRPLRECIAQPFRSLLGVGITLPLMMLAWVPFRAQSLTDSLHMLARVFQPQHYFSLGLRENTYLVAAGVMLCVFLAYWIARVVPLIERRAWLTQPVIAFGTAAVVVPVVIVFLRPISQFIYFQF